MFLTHEARTSANADVFVPFTRINDGKMYMMSIKPSTGLEFLKFVSSIRPGKHLKHPYFKAFDVTDAKIDFPEKTNV